MSTEAATPVVPDRDTDVYGRILDVARQTHSRADFLTWLLREIGDHFQSPYAAIHVRFASELLQDDWHSGPSNPGFWKAQVQAFLTDSLAESRPRTKLLKARNGSTQAAYLAVPIHGPGRSTVGAIAIVVPNASKIDLSAALVKLEALCRFGLACRELHDAVAARLKPTGEPDRTSARRRGWATLTTRGHWARKAAAALLVVTTAWFALGTMGYHVTVPVTVASADARQITMPLDGILAESFVVEGDTVRRGDILCTLDTHELRQRHKELEAEESVVQRRFDEALAARDPVAARQATAQLELIRAREALLDDQLQQTVVRTPIDGIVVEGDLKPWIGASLSRGHALLTVAPPGRLRLELEIPRAAVADASLPLRGVFAYDADPDRTQPFEIAPLLPNATYCRDRRVYITEAAIETSPEWMRPGTEGTGRIYVGRRRVWWVALHRALDSLNVSSWR